MGQIDESSSAGRPRQVAADRARAGEVLLAHFPASLSLSRLAGGLRHTESVRDCKVQEQDWRQALEQKSRAPPARPRGDITAQSHSVPGAHKDDQVRTLRTVADTRSNDPVRSQASSEKRISLSDGSSRSVAAYHEAAGVRSLVLAMSHLELIASGTPSRPRNGTTSSTVTASLTRGLRVLRMFGQSRLSDGGFQQIATTAIVPFNTGLWQHSSQAFSGWFGGSRQTVKSRHFVPTACFRQRTFRR